MATPPPVKRLALPNALIQRELDARQGKIPGQGSRFPNVARSPEKYRIPFSGPRPAPVPLKPYTWPNGTVSRKSKKTRKSRKSKRRGTRKN